MSSLLQFDNFASDAPAIRNAVIDGGFHTETGPDGAEYTGISRYPVPHWHERISILLQSDITPKMSGFRLNLKGEMPHSWVHSDDICAKWASVLYLNLPEQCQGGTAFWKHKQTGFTQLRQTNDSDYHRWMTAEWKRLDAWERYGLARMKFNRFITYPTCFFHSRWPFEAFGSTPQDGRLIWVCFYDLS